jgi:murein DD-endopeptidase MepM/ murein hydrolase activator NlpD
MHRIKTAIGLFVACAYAAALTPALAASCAPSDYNVGERPKLKMPSTGELAKPYGWQYHEMLHRPTFHSGIDLDGDAGSPVTAALGGEVIERHDGGYLGNFILIDHGNGLRTGYGHMSSVAVAKGDCVSVGQTIAATGCTGVCAVPHLHFEVRLGDEYLDPGPLLNLYERQP